MEDEKSQEPMLVNSRCHNFISTTYGSKHVHRIEELRTLPVRELGERLSNRYYCLYEMFMISSMVSPLNERMICLRKKYT